MQFLDKSNEHVEKIRLNPNVDYHLSNKLNHNKLDTVHFKFEYETNFLNIAKVYQNNYKETSIERNNQTSYNMKKSLIINSVSVYVYNVPFSCSKSSGEMVRSQHFEV